jgi:hypothetical protein
MCCVTRQKKNGHALLREKVAPMDRTEHARRAIEIAEAMIADDYASDSTLETEWKRLSKVISAMTPEDSIDSATLVDFCAMMFNVAENFGTIDDKNTALAEGARLVRRLHAVAPQPVKKRKHKTAAVEGALFHKRPVGRAPAGCVWNNAIGQWNMIK